MKLSQHMSTQLMRSVLGCALLGSAAFAEDIIISNKTWDSNYTYSAVEGTTTFSNITAPGISIAQRGNKGPLNIVADTIISTGNVYIQPNTGNVTLSNFEVGLLNASTGNGTITLSGDIKAEGNASMITGAYGGSIILNSANCENIYVGYNDGGEIQISGDTTLSNVYFKAETVNVADDANLTLDDVFFAHRNAIEQEEGANTALTLGDNVTLTLAEGSMLDVTELTVGTGLNLVITLSKEAFATLDNTTFDIFSVQEGEVDLTGANVSFTDGEQTKTGTITAEGGSITVTDSYVVPEPTTATLSLVALAALAARRRRK